MDSPDIVEHEQPLVEQHRWFFELTGEVLRDAATAQAAVEARVEATDAEDVTAAALALFLAGEIFHATGEAALLQSERAALLVDAVARRLERELQPSMNAFTDTWAIALWAAALRGANHALDRADLALLVGRVKNHVYARHTRGGTLMSSSDRTRLDYSVLLTAVPFGLFDPEDLALVDAVRTLSRPERLAAASPADRALTGWYFAEQGNYARARVLVADAAEPALQNIVALRLKAVGQLDERFIRHRPEGNGNRYEPLIEERFPKMVTAGDPVTVRALASPLSADEPLELVTGGEVHAGTFRGDCFEFVLAPQPEGTVVEYVLRFRRHPNVTSERFRYEVLARRSGGTLLVRGQRLTFVPGEHALEPLQLRNLTVAEASSLQSADGRVHEITLSLEHPPCRVHGLGERYNALDQAGNVVDQFVYNQYKDQGLRTYMPMPVFYTDAGFGLHLDTTAYSWFDFRQPGRTRLGIEAEAIEIDLLTGSVNEQVAQFITAAGEPAPVPDWALGPWMSSNNWDSEAEVRKQVALTNEHGIPATVLVVEAWSDEATFYIFNDAQYDAKPDAEAFAYDDFTFPEWGRWPDPRGMVEHLHDSGLKLILWQIPVIKHTAALRHGQKQRDEAHFLSHGFGVRYADGTALRLPEGWFKDSLLMDFTNREAVAWWFSKRQYLIDLGVDGFKTDGGEMVWGLDLQFADGTNGLTNRNKYPRDYIAAYYEFAQQNGGICFSRAGYTGAQTFPAHWAGDERSTWDAFKRSILAGLSAGISGVIFWGWDLGGFSGEVPSAELFIRSAQMACFCPIMQYHAESKAEFNQDRTPWNIAERSGDRRALVLYARFANLRMQLLPYFVQEAAQCVAAKTPLMRAMLLDHADDPKATPLWDQYRLGRDLLVAPVIREGDTSREVYLPRGRWWHLLQGRWYDGERTHTVEAPLEEIPVFLREGALLPLAFADKVQLGATMPSGVNPPKRLVLLSTGGAASLRYGDMDFAVSTTAEEDVAITVSGPTALPCTVVFAEPSRSVRLNGALAEAGSISLGGAPLPAVQVSPATS